MRCAPMIAVAPVLALLAACHGHTRAEVVVQPLEHRPVSILVEVYDPATNLVWENVGVRIVAASHEWSGCTCQSPYERWYLTDSNGRVLLDEYDLGSAEVGFVEGYDGSAVLCSGRYEDEASVLIEVDAFGFTPVLVDVDLRWDEADVFVEVPFR